MGHQEGEPEGAGIPREPQPTWEELSLGVRGAWEGPGRPGAHRCAELTLQPAGARLPRG